MVNKNILICILALLNLALFCVLIYFLIKCKKENFIFKNDSLNIMTTPIVTTIKPDCQIEHMSSNVQIYDPIKIDKYKTGDLVRDYYWVLKRNDKKFQIKTDDFMSIMLISKAPPSLYTEFSNTNYWIKVNKYFQLGTKPINRYPWIGAHDSATGSTPDTLTNLKSQLPLVKTQRFDFIDQYEKGGATFFDLRLITDNNMLRFAHGPITLQYIKDEISFPKLLNKVINNKDLIILYIVKEKREDTMTDIIDKLKKYITGLKINSNCEFVDNLSQLEKCVNYYINKDINILIIPQDYKNVGLVKDNWQNYFSNMKCFKGDQISSIGDIFDLARCRNYTCLGKSNSYWNEMFDMIKKAYNKYIEDSPKSLTILQTFWQCATEPKEIFQATRCLLDENIGFTAINTEIQSFMNSKMYKFFYNNRKFKPNVLLFDNVNECTRKLNLLLTSDYKYPETENCLNFGQKNDKCIKNIDCENDACGRKNADTSDYICCPTDSLTSGLGTGFKDYCAKMPSGTSCLVDGQCSSNECKTPWYQFNIGKGTCT